MPRSPAFCGNPNISTGTVSRGQVKFPSNGKPFSETITNYYLHNFRKHQTTIGIKDDDKHQELAIEGSFFCQQNGLTHVCAHAVLRMAINNYILHKGEKLTNKKINDLLNVDYSRFPKGLAQKEIQEVIQLLGYRYQSHNFHEKTNVDCDFFLYPALESCCPTILGLEWWNAEENGMERHVVAVLGHTINSDRWDHEARSGYACYPKQPYISSACYCDHYIISDDNYGMYGTLPAEMLKNYIVPSKNPNLHPTIAITIVPESVTTSGYIPEKIATRYAKKLVGNMVKGGCREKWIVRLNAYDLVCRTLLLKKERYLQRLESYISAHDEKLIGKIRKRFDSLSEYLWVTEISLPDIYTGNKHKLAEVVTRADATEKEHINRTSIAMAWFPGFIQIDMTSRPETWPIETHVPLIRNSDRIPLLEW